MMRGKEGNTGLFAIPGESGRPSCIRAFTRGSTSGRSNGIQMGSRWTLFTQSPQEKWCIQILFHPIRTMVDIS